MEPNEPVRGTRTITWEDPLSLAAAGPTMTGIEFLRSLLAGLMPPPPMAQLLGFSLVEVEEGTAVFATEPAEYHYNPIGLAHGGLAATLLDSAMGCAIHTTLPAGARYTTLEIKVNFVRAVTAETGRLLCRGRVIHRGRTTATAGGELYSDMTGKLHAHGTTTCLIWGAPAPG